MVSDAQRAVEGMISRSTPFPRIEDYINGLTLSENHQGALWLLAWAEAASPIVRRRIVEESLARP